MDLIPRHEFNACVKRYGGDHRLRYFSCRDQFSCMAFVPAFIRISRGKTHEVRVLDELPIERGAFSVMDKAYIDFSRLDRMHCQAAFFGRFSRSDQSAGGGLVPDFDSLHVRCAPSGVVRAVACHLGVGSGFWESCVARLPETPAHPDYGSRDSCV